MSSLSEEEITKILQELIDMVKEYGFDYTVEEAVVINKNEYNAIQGLLDLYNKEKEKNTELQNYMKEYLIPKSTINLLYISKDKIREEIKKKMKYLYVDSCAEDSGKYSAYMSILNLLEEE